MTEPTQPSRWQRRRASVRALAFALALASGPATLAVSPARAQDAHPAPSNLNVPELFATTCGWCHNGGGRVAGKGPQLMNTARSDDFIRNRIKLGKEGAMPAFRASFSDADIEAIVVYIRGLKPEQN